MTSTDINFCFSQGTRNSSDDGFRRFAARMETNLKMHLGLEIVQRLSPWVDYKAHRPSLQDDRLVAIPSWVAFCSSSLLHSLPPLTLQSGLWRTFMFVTRSYRQMASADRLSFFSIIVNPLLITIISAVLAGSTTTNTAFPGPLIRGRKVISNTFTYLLDAHCLIEPAVPSQCG